jgi:nucleotidyltransferase substrate binding protein (TIGR01987 family)
MDHDIRWKQRFENYCKAFDSLKKAVFLSRERELSELEKQGVIQGFEFTFELAWKVVKDYLEYMNVDVKFPREVIKKGLQYDILDDGEIWIDMLGKRNLMAHTYDENKAEQALDLITKQYYQQLEKLHCFFSTKTNE